MFYSSKTVIRTNIRTGKKRYHFQVHACVRTHSNVKQSKKRKRKKKERGS
jgi:hypothetical protein